MRTLYIFFLLLIPSAHAFSQANFIWAKSMGGPESDAGWALATDNSGNIYTTGFFSNTADLDPGGAVLNFSSNGLEDIFIVKMDASGSLVWARQIGGTGGDRGFALAVDPSGNIFVTGAFVGTVDFDPGPGTLTLSSASTYGDMYIVKLDPSGNLIWAGQYGGSGGITGYSIALDPAGNVYAAGAFTGSIDFDPGPGSTVMTSTGSYDIFVSKTSSGGNFIWAKQFGGTSGFEDNICTAVAVDNSGNVYTTGAFEDTTDFDPGIGTFLVDSTGMFISKLDASGNFLWAKNIVSQSIIANSICVDNSGNLLLAGGFSYTADFDPGPGTSFHSAPGTRDIFIMKMSPSGNFVWAKQMGSATGGDNAFGITTDASGNIYSAGSFTDNADMDPGAATYDLISAGADDIFISKLDASGNFICASQMGGTDVDYAYGIALDASANIYLTGAYRNSVDLDPGPGTDNHNSNGQEDIFMSTISDCTFILGNSEKQETGAFSIYPIPAHDQLFIRSENEISSVRILDMLGRQQIQALPGNSIDLGALANGVYFISVTINNEEYHRHFIKE